MLVYIPGMNKCSKCGSVEEPEFVTLNMEIFKRCVVCGHESAHSKTYTSGNETGNIVYTVAATISNPVEY